jgi:phage terminase large subunit-like protein
MLKDWRRLGRKCCVYVERGDVLQRAEPAHKAVYNAFQAGKPWILCANPWVEGFIGELQAFPSKHWHDDQVVALSNGLLLLEELAKHGRFESGRERPER